MDNKYVILPTGSDILHFGKGHEDQPPGRGSGRYAWGSGKRPRRRERKQLKLEQQREKTKQEILRSGDARAVLSIQSALTVEELREAANRINLNIELSGYDSKQHPSKWDKMNKYMSRTKDVVNWTNTGISAWNSFAKMYNSTTNKDQKLPTINGGGNKKKG